MAETMPCRQTIKSASNKNYKHDRLIYCQETFFSLSTNITLSSKKFLENITNTWQRRNVTFPLLFVQLLTKCGGGENIIIQLLDEMNVSESVISQKGLSWIGMQTYHFQVHIKPCFPEFSKLFYGQAIPCCNLQKHKMR